MIGRLAALNEEHQQSPWLDNLRRGWLTGGDWTSGYNAESAA